MNASGPDNTAELYINSAGNVSGQDFQMRADEIGWLIEHATRIGELRLGLLRSLQAALGREEEGEIAELKELLTNLIIMQSRLAEREAGLSELMNKVIRSNALEGVPVDGEALRNGVEAMLRAAEHIERSASS